MCTEAQRQFESRLEREQNKSQAWKPGQGASYKTLQALLDKAQQLEMVSLTPERGPVLQASVFCINVLCNGVQLDVGGSFIYCTLNKGEKKGQLGIHPQLKRPLKDKSAKDTSPACAVSNRIQCPK